MVLDPRLLLGVFGIAGTAVGTGVVLASSLFKGSETPLTPKEERELVNGEFTSHRKYKIPSIDSSSSGEGCFIYWIDKVYSDDSDATTSFDELKGKYTKKEKEKFFQEASLSEEDKKGQDIMSLCLSGNGSHSYVWKENGVWSSTSGGEYA
ncbi:hypothetical protein MHF_0418 [Mycoplasma haemofelis Ohio2]|uniref:Uncharacterized protein n=1 Tax=Mycoplasma haemofelis (strain Ohio2) TaxID=859194 RepID=F6FH89_MYCHI|nr:hypothetical protein MHF_0418 [Mycoplasma haemofelis Ohio2]